MTVDSVVRKPSLWALYGAFVLTGVVNTILGPLLPWFAVRWTIADRVAGSLFSAEFAGGLLGGIASGWIAAHSGTGRTMGAGMLLMAAGPITAALGPLRFAAGGMFIAGLGLGFVIPSMNLLMARLEPHRRAAALSALNLSWGLGAIAWPIVVALLQPLSGVPPILLLLSVCLAASARHLWRLPPTSVDVAQLEGGHARQSATIAALLGALIVVYSGVEMALGGWLTEYGRRVAGVASAQSGHISAAMFWGGLTVGRAGIAVRLDDRHENAVLFTGLLAAASSIPVLLLSSSAAWLAAAAMCAGLGMAPVFPVTVAAVSRRCAPRVASVLIALAALGGATIPWLVGLVSDSTGSLAFGLTVLLGLLCLQMAGHALRTRLERSQLRADSCT